LKDLATKLKPFKYSDCPYLGRNVIFESLDQEKKIKIFFQAKYKKLKKKISVEINLIFSRNYMEKSILEARNEMKSQ